MESDLAGGEIFLQFAKAMNLYVVSFFKTTKEAILKNRIIWIAVAIITFNINQNHGQITNAGKDFWFGFTEVYDSTSASFVVYISSLVNSSGTVTVPGQGVSKNFTVTPGTITKVTLTLATVEATSTEVLENKAVHVTSNNDVVVYAHTYHTFRSDASLILPVTALGNDYYVSSYDPNTGNGGHPSEFLVIGSGSSVTVEITPSAATMGGHSANVPFNVTLGSGQVYQVQSMAGDLTGSRVRSTNSSDKFSVIGASKFPRIPTSCGSTMDPIYEQLFPVSSWGKNYIFVPTPLVNDDICRVVASQNGTTVSINGTQVATLNAGQSYEQTIITASLITASQPVSVARYLKGAGCVANPVDDPNSVQSLGDPAMVVIDANEQMFLDTITFYAPAVQDIDSSYLQIVTRTADINTIYLDAVNMGSRFTTLAANTAYSYMSIRVDTGAHTIKSNGCGFLAYITGLGGAESYAYAAGVALQNFSSIIPDAACSDSTVQFSSTAIGSSIAWQWDFGDGNTSTAQNPSHTYSTSGTRTVTLIVTYNSGCTDTISKSITLSSCIPALPVQLLFFDARYDNGVVQTSWSTASEINNSYFTVEKSIDAENFSVAGTVKGAGNSMSVLNYALIDRSPYQGVSYYRLKQTDYDGTASYSRVIAVSAAAELAIFPNPAHDNLYIHLPDKDRRVAHLLDLNGKEVLSSMELVQGTQSLDLRNLGNGIYILKIIEETGVKYVKIVKQ